MSLRQVIKPHMKNSEVTIVIAAVLLLPDAIPAAVTVEVLALVIAIDERPGGPLPVV